MKRLTIFLSLLTIGLLLATATAYMQGVSRPQSGGPTNTQPAKPEILPQTYLNENRVHKLIISDRETALYNQLAQANAIRNVIDYGGYRLVVVDEEAAGGRAALQSLPAPPRDDQNMIVLNGYLIDTGKPQPLPQDLPADLKRGRMNATIAGTAAAAPGLYLVQFVGPIKDEWFKTLEKTGAQIIAYAPNNAYVVHADERTAGEIVKMKQGNSFVQWVGDYEPAYKLTPGLRARSQSGDSQPVKVRVQILDGAAGNLKIDELKASASRYFSERRVQKYRNLTVTIPVSQLAELAKSDEVFAIEEDREYVRMDEAQGQIIAGNLSGNRPSGPGYLSWLAGKGFNGSQFTSFAVNVADDAYSLRGHPDLPDSRIAFENNPARVMLPVGGHGFLNSHIIGGFNDGAGSAYEDANGFNYGLGIAPWARVGVTNIFCGSSLCQFSDEFNPARWEEVAYGQGARISSNSWGADQGRYDTLAQEYDYLVRDAQGGVPGDQQLTIVFAAGNAGETGDGSLGSPGTAKNVITVGASENVRQTPGVEGCGGNLAADSANDVAYFSARGPVNPDGGDGRIKPDLVAPGVRIQAGAPQSSNYLGFSVCTKYFPLDQTLYTWSSGTSHAAPAVAGAAAMIHQDFLNQGLAAPSPAMVKAVLMNSASYLTGEGANDALPSKSQGMGLVDLGRAFDRLPRLLTDQTKVFGSSGETHYVFGSVASSSQPFRVTLAWTDAPGTTTAAPWVNNLDLEVTINGQTYKGNVFSGSSSTIGGAPDGKNNVESVFLPAGVSGDFVVALRASNIAGDGFPGNEDPTDQDFALVVYNATSTSPNSPVIDVRPAALNFSSVLGLNPGNQMIDLRNAGIDALNWTASDDAPWLTLTPASGAAPSSLTAAVNTGGLAIGTYQGTITIRSANAFNSPVNVPVSLTISPVFVVAPSSLSFTAKFDSGNPSNQTMSIANNDSGLRGWTASGNAPWLTLAPASGAAPAPLTASVDVSGLSTGIYHATITLRAANPLAAPVIVPVTLLVDAVGSGGFEAPDDLWVLSGAAMRSSGGISQSGTGYLLMGGANDSRGSACQEITLPWKGSLNLSFWLNVTSVDTAATANDRLFIEVRDARGKLLKTLATFSNLDRSMPGNYLLRGKYNLASLAGRTVRIQFRTITDPSSVTSFRIDDVSVK